MEGKGENIGTSAQDANVPKKTMLCRTAMKSKQLRKTTLNLLSSWSICFALQSTSIESIPASDVKHR
jgi:hypothetical protein